MTRPRKPLNRIIKTLYFPEPVAAKVDLLLFSELEGRVPYNAWVEFLVPLIEAYFKKLEAAKLEFPALPTSSTFQSLE